MTYARSNPATPSVTIRYRRPPDRVQVFEQRVLERRPDCVVTFLERSPLNAPMVLNGRIVLEDGSPVVWFTFPGAWHDIGRFHRADGAFTGIYANILTPVRDIASSHWDTTDLFLDVWAEDGRIEVLDADELDAAVAARWVDRATARRARDEAAALVQRARHGDWPPPIVHEWTLERARKADERQPWIHRAPHAGPPPLGQGDQSAAEST